MGSGGFGVGVLQAIAVNSRIEENARHPTLNRSINTTEKGGINSIKWGSDVVVPQVS